MEKIYCFSCGKIIDSYDVISKELDFDLKGEIYHYQGKEAVCPVCGATVFVNDILKYNKEQAYNAVRMANDIISQKDILSIPEKYNVGKRNISKYLGWGEITFSRYCSGYIPTKHNSDILKEVLDNPEYLKEKIKKYLQENPDDENARKDLQKINFSGLFNAIVNMNWDDETDKWIATSTDIPGLELEADSFDMLTDQVEKTVPELLKRNKLPNTAMIQYHTNKKQMIYA